MYDVIVIGAGPCGCSAAITLAQNGFKVLLTEKCKVPRYKSCSGILIEKSLLFIERHFGSAVPTFVTCAPADNRGMIFTDDSGREYRFDSRGLNVWRDKFDFWLLSLAQNAGAEIKDDCVVTHVRESDNLIEVYSNEKVFQAKYAIDCSGAVGIDKKPHNHIITYQSYNKGSINLEPHYFYAYLQTDLSGFDACFNVKDNMIVLGVASAVSKDIVAYYDNFISYMKVKHGLIIDKELRTDKWIIRNIMPPFNVDYGAGGILKAGESAGFLNPMGEGISSALESGYGAAFAIISNFDNRKNVIEEYKRNVSATQLYMQRQWELVGRISNKFSYMYNRA